MIWYGFCFKKEGIKGWFFVSLSWVRVSWICMSKVIVNWKFNIKYGFCCGFCGNGDKFIFLWK